MEGEVPTAYVFVTTLVLVVTEALKNVTIVRKIPTQFVAILLGVAALGLYQFSVGEGIESTVWVSGVHMGLAAIGVWQIANRKSSKAGPTSP